MSLSEFHNSVAVTQDDTSSGPSNQVRMNWADEMDKLTNDESPSERTFFLCLVKYVLFSNFFPLPHE